MLSSATPGQDSAEGWRRRQRSGNACGIRYATRKGKNAVADGWTALSDKAKTFAVDWTAYAALGSVVLYLLGYLALRFHLTVLGIGTDLSVLDERYLFAGAKFLVYLVSAELLLY